MGKRGREFVTTDESAFLAKPLFDPIVVEDGQSGGRLANPTRTDQSDRGETFCEGNNLLDQLVASKEDPWWRRRRFPSYARWKYEKVDSLVVSDRSPVSGLRDSQYSLGDAKRMCITHQQILIVTVPTTF